MMFTNYYLGTLPQQISALSLVALLGLVLRYRLGWRRLSIEGQKQQDTDEADIRDHYAQEVAALRQKLADMHLQFRADLLELETRYRKMLNDSEDRHEQCMADRDILRERVNQLEDELRGLIRVITQASIDRVLMIGTEMPDDIREAALRVENIIKAKGRE